MSDAVNPHPRITVRREVASNRFFTFAEEDLALPQGGAYTYYQLESHYDAVVVVPRFDDGQLLLERIYRHPYRCDMLEFPAGGIEPGEDPIEAGRRELAEETGYHAARLEPLVALEAMPGLLRMRLHFVLATGLTPGAERRLEALELLQVAVMSEAQAWAEAEARPGSSFLTMGLLALQRSGR